MKLILTSSICSVAKSFNKILDLKSGKRACFINTAAEIETGDLEWLKKDRQSLIDAGFELEDYTISHKRASLIYQYLQTFSYIYISGGNVFYLLEQSINSGFIDVIHDLVINHHKTYIGSSAGSIIAGPTLPRYLRNLDKCNNNEIMDAPAYNLVNFTLLPHWNSPYFRQAYLTNKFDTLYNSHQTPLVFLNDKQYIIVNDDQFELVDLNPKEK